MGAEEQEEDVKEDRKQRLVQILYGADDWVSASTLSRMLGVSSRTIRNYIRQLSNEYEILSSQSGYRLHTKSSEPTGTDKPSLGAEQDQTPHGRAIKLLSDLLVESGPVSLFDLAERLMVSESTVTNVVIPLARREASFYDVRFINHDFELSLDGSEANIRRLLHHLVSENCYGYFQSAKTLSSMFPEDNVPKIQEELVGICQDSGLFLNNYSLNNLLVHVLVMAVRLRSNNKLNNAHDAADAKTLRRSNEEHARIAKCTASIQSMLEHHIGRPIPEDDLRQIELLVSLTSGQGSDVCPDASEIRQLTDNGFPEAVAEIASKTAHRYGIPPFSNDFLLRLTLHTYNAYQRSVLGVSFTNPIANQIRRSYTLVYDMAIYFCHGLESRLNVSFSEDEIAFVAYHLGAYIAKNFNDDQRVNCTVVTERYHGYSADMVATVESTFSNRLSVSRIVDFDEYLHDPAPADLVITTTKLPATIGWHAVLVSPVLGRRDLRAISKELEAIEEEREVARAKAFLEQLIKPELFMRNRTRPSVDGYLELMGGQCMEFGYVNQAFVNDVKLREQVSSTAFMEGLAIPHSISVEAKRSFICVLHNDSPIPWGEHRVNVVMLFGLSGADLHNLRGVFDAIIERFENADSLAAILASDGFEEFKDALIG